MSDKANGPTTSAQEAWDPLQSGSDDPGFVLAAQKREIRNILKSYTGYHDLFAEMLQNELDAVEKRAEERQPDYKPSIWIRIDIPNETVSVTDNGCAMNLAQFRGFLRPNFSFKEGSSSRGSKGVGATFLAYGFNYLEVATKLDPKAVHTGLLEHGREWLEDNANTVSRPKVQPVTPSHEAFQQIDRGTSFTLKLVGDAIRPRSLKYFIAKDAETWLCILRAHTPLGGLYLCGDKPPAMGISVEVVGGNPELTSIARLEEPKYLYPHEVLGRTADLREFLKDQKARVERGQDVSKVPAKFSSLNGVWGEWTGRDILSNRSPIKPRLDDAEKGLISELLPQVYTFMAFSTDLWDDYNDNKLHLRKHGRILSGGLQLSTRHMPQGHPVTIPLTNNIGFQNITHVIVHFQTAEPDLGRKGFQPEHTTLAEKLAVSSVTAFRHYFERLLRKNTGAPALMQEVRLEKWIEDQKEHEKAFPLVVTGVGLFAPEEKLAIRSFPLVEQDVVALFNQMLTSGVIRGIQLLASSQFNQYDGLYRIQMDQPFDKYVRSTTNPLGVDGEHFSNLDGPVVSSVRILEYKYSLDALMEELDNGQKSADDIGLAVCWELGELWRRNFDILSFLDNENVHHREQHAVTHQLYHGVSRLPAFQVIALKDLVSFLRNPAAESARQHKLYAAEIEI